MSNVNRHLCSYGDVNKYKTNALKSYLNSKYPYIEVNTYNEDVLYYDKLEELLSYSDLIVITVGMRNVEHYLASILEKHKKTYLISFVEPYLSAGHIILSNSFDCFKSKLFNENLDFTASVIKDTGYHLREFGCTSSFNQYGVFDMKKFIYISFDTVQDFVFKKQSKHICVTGNLDNAVKSGANVKFRYLDTLNSWKIEVEDI